MKKTFFTKLYIISLCLYFGSGLVYSQNAEEEVDTRPVRSPFETGLLIDNQTIVSPVAKTLLLEIHHRFSSVSNGFTDLYGIYGASNIRLGLKYGLTDRLMIGFGTEKYHKLQEFQLKYSILHQTRSGNIPVAVSFYGNMVIDARSKDKFGVEENFKSIHRLSYFSQIIIARKFSPVFTFQIAPSFIYFNAVEPDMQNINFGLSAGGRAKIAGSLSILFEYDQPLTINEVYEPKANLGLGLEIGTSTHAFQIFFNSYDQIINQRNYVYNTNDFTEGEMMLGFNITVRF